MGVERRLKSTPRTPTLAEAMHYSLPWVRESRGEWGGCRNSGTLAASAS